MCPVQPLRLRLFRAILEAAGDPPGFSPTGRGRLPLGILEGLPRTPHVFEEQTSWRLDRDTWEPALAWVPNYASMKDDKDFVRAKFDEDVEEGLMDRMTLGELKLSSGRTGLSPPSR